MCVTLLYDLQCGLAEINLMSGVATLSGYFLEFRISREITNWKPMASEVQVELSFRVYLQLLRQNTTIFCFVCRVFGRESQKKIQSFAKDHLSAYEENAPVRTLPYLSSVTRFGEISPLWKN